MITTNRQGTEFILGAFTTHVIFTVAGAVSTLNNWWLVSLCYMVFIEKGFIDWKRKESPSLYYSVNLILVCLRLQYLMSSYTMLLVMWDQEKVRKHKSVVDKMFKSFYMLLEDVSIPYIKPYFGSNNMLLGQVKDKVTYWFEDAVGTVKSTLSVGPVTSVTYLRELGISETPQLICDKPPEAAETVQKRWEDLERSTKFGVMVILTAACFLMVGPFTLVPVIIGLLVTSFDEGPTLKIMEKNKGIMFRDGVYLVKTEAYGVEVSRGIGVSSGGIFHVPFHVVNGKPVYYGKTRVQPYMVNVREDLVTYGGPPKITKYQPGDVVYVNCETETARNSYEVEVDVDSLSGVIAWQGVTKPGESGSPVLAYRYDDDNSSVVLLGLAGRYVKDARGCTEYSNNTEVVDGPSMKETITLHPGAGKTWKVIPDIIRRRLIESGGRRVLVCGPTRVVCSELFESLRKETEVGLNIKDSRHRNEYARVQIAAHRTAVRMLNNRARCLRNLGTIIIDEAHVDDAATKLLRMYAEDLMSNDTKIYELSATLDGITNDASNFTITDEEISPGDVENEVRSELEAGKRVLVFLPSMRGRAAQKLRKAFKDYNPISLSRETFNTAMIDVKDEGRRLILSTDIAECGINIPELDTVVDLGERFTYVYEGGLIIGRKVGLTAASRTQRRGRVGRSKPGSYKEVMSTLTNNYVSASEFDAQMLACGRTWAYGKTDWGLMLTDHQFSIWSEKDLTPLEVWLDYDNLGNKRSDAAKRATFREMCDGTTVYSGCHDNCGKCNGTYRYFDERIHDRIVMGSAHQKSPQVLW